MFEQPHLTRTVSQAGKTTLAPLHETLEARDKKPSSYYRGNIVQRYNFLTVEHFVCLADACLLYKVINRLAPSFVKGFNNTVLR